MPTRMTLLIAAVSLLVTPALAAGDVSATCPVPQNTFITTRLADLPAAVARRVPGLRDSDATQSGDTHLIRAFMQNGRWVVLYSSNVRTDPWRALVVDIGEDGTSTTLSDIEGWQFPGGACQAIDAGFEAPKPR